MPVNDLLFYGMDIVILFMFLQMVQHSKEVELEIKVGSRWIIYVFFGFIAVVSFIRFAGLFRWIQSAALIVFAFLYANMKSGLSKRGIVMMGRLVPYEKAGVVRVSNINSCIIYKIRGREGALFFDREQLTEIKDYLREKSVKSETI